MPKEMSTHPEPYQHHFSPTDAYSTIFTGWSYPPKDFAKWGELAYQWAKHCVDKYGRKEVETWYWEVWNEPNIGYWRGTQQQFQILHDYAVAGVRRALPTARTGGPDVAGTGGRFMTNFLNHCLHGTNFATGAIGTPMDFVSFHAKGAPVNVTNGTSTHVRMGIAAQLRTIDEGFRMVASYPELKETPIVIGESDPEGCAACQGPQLGYRNGTMYSSYTAASFAREHDLADLHGVNFTGALTWAFEFENQPYFAGFRAVASEGIDLPVLNVFRMFSKMSGDRVSVESDGAVPLEMILRRGVRAKPDVSALASRAGKKIAIMVWHYHDDDLPGPVAQVDLTVDGLTGSRARLTEYRIDGDHSNAYTAWQKMGSPAQPTPAQVAELEKAGHLAVLGNLETVPVKSGKASVYLQLPRQAVTLLVFEGR
jgi:xylan 1,4-beta-xylosidase